MRKKGKGDKTNLLHPENLRKCNFFRVSCRGVEWRLRERERERERERCDAGSGMEKDVE